uniref:hypothetical protein n=1 Tax=Flavobacterium sp. TaxID=239 RepID=UPI00404ADB92
MKLPISILVLILSLTSCKEKKDSKVEPKKEQFEIKQTVKPTENIDLSKVPDSLKVITDKILKADFNGDDKIDFAAVVKNKKNQKTGVLIIQNSENNENFVFGAGKEVDQMTDLAWIEVFETLPKGQMVSPSLVDEETGDIIGQDESQNFKLIGSGLYMSVKESHGGGIIFWNGEEYKWYHIE